MKFELNKKTNEYILVAGDDVPTVVIPREYDGRPVTRIGTNAFSGCTTLTNVTIPDSVTSIAICAFNRCTSLNSITIPDSVTNIGADAFYNCRSLTSITIPDSVTSIGFCAFYECTLLTSVTIGNGVTSIGISAFDGCDLQYNEYDNGYYLGNENNHHVALIKAKSEDITSCTIHNGTKVIGDSAFRNCTSLTSITIPDSVTSIGYDAFEGCTSLTSVYYNGDKANWDKITFGDVYANPLYYGATLHTKLEKRERKQSMKFILNGCDISFIAEAPEDITLKQLIKQCDKIIPDWCACGICSLDYKSYDESIEPDIIIGYDSIKKANEDVSCSIQEKENEKSND